MKYKQYLFCLETTKKANTDWLYIHKVIDYLNKDKQVFDSYKPLYMNGKGNYRNKSFLRILNSTINMFDGESVIIYCVDLDDYHINPRTKEYIDEVEKFCDDNGYKFVYFSRDVEEVFWGKRISKEEKTKYAMKFSKDIEIREELIIRLSKKNKIIKTSNLCLYE